MNTNIPQSNQNPNSVRDEGKVTKGGIAKGLGIFVAGAVIGNSFGGASQGNTETADRAVSENPATTIVLDTPVDTLRDPTTTTIAVEQTTTSEPTADTYPADTTDLTDVETTQTSTTTTEVVEDKPYLEALQSPERNEQLVSSMTDGMFNILESLNRNEPIKKRLGVDQDTNTSGGNSYEIRARGYYQLRKDELSITANVSTQLELDTDSTVSVDDLLVSGLEVETLDASYEDPNSERAGGFYSRSYPYKTRVSVQKASELYVVQVETMDDETGNTIRTIVSGDSVRKQTISPGGNIVSSEELRDPSAIAEADLQVQVALSKIADSVSE